MSSASAITHPDYSAKGGGWSTLSFAARERGLGGFGMFEKKILNPLFPPQAKRGWSSEAKTG